MRSVRLAILCAAVCVAACLFSAPAGAQRGMAARPPQHLRTIFIVRHGAYDEGDTLDEHLGRHLTDLGREQAKLVGEYFAKLPIRIQAIYGSTMTRARETAEIAGAQMGMKPELDPEICECGPPTADTTNAYHEPAEEQERCRVTLDRAFARYFRPSPDADTAIVLFCHGNVERYFVCKALGVDPAATWRKFSIINGNISRIEVRPNGRISVVAFGEVGHLPPAMQTWNWKQKVYKEQP